MKKGELFLVSSPSGGGKGTLVQALLKKLSNIGYSVSYTTRKIRDGEKPGREYNFVSKEEFELLIAENEFLEYAEVHGNYYGTSKSAVTEMLESGRDVILEIDVQGVEIVASNEIEAIGIFILPPNFDVLEERLRKRSTENDDALKVRLDNARREVKAVDLFDYVVLNDDLEEASLEICSIVMAERQKLDRQKAVIRDILNTFEK